MSSVIRTICFCHTEWMNTGEKPNIKGKDGIYNILWTGRRMEGKTKILDRQTGRFPCTW